MTNQEFKYNIIDFNKKLSIVPNFFSENVANIERLENVLLELKNLLISYEGLSLEKESKEYRKKLLAQINRWNKYPNDNNKKSKICKKLAILFFNIIHDLFLDEEYENVHINDNKKIILFVASKPTDLSFIRFNQEYQKILDIIENTDNCQYKLYTQLALKKEDLEGLLKKYNPDILHFSGHGDVAGLAMEARNERATYADNIYFDNLLQQYSIEGLYFNACFSGKLIDKINNDYYDYGIGNYDELNDFLAIDFATSFYLNLIEQKTSPHKAYHNAFENCSINIDNDDYVNNIKSILGRPDTIDTIKYDLKASLDNMEFFKNNIKN